MLGYMDVMNGENGVFGEILKAEEKHPAWPRDIIHAAAVVSEEAGELVQACNDYVYSDRDKGEVLKAIKTEALQTAAMAIRFLKNLKKLEALKAKGMVENEDFARAVAEMENSDQGAKK